MSSFNKSLIIVVSCVFSLIFSCGENFLEASGKISDEEIYQFKLKNLKPNDHAGFLELGKWSEEKGHIQWARKCYRKAIEPGYSPSYPEASFRLARIEISLGKMSQAFKRLRKIKSKYGYKDAEQLLAETENKLILQQKDLVNQAEAAFNTNLYLKAGKLFAKAIEILPEKDTNSHFINENDLLLKIIRCRKALDQAFRRIEATGLYSSVVKACPDCEESAYPGFRPCSACKGGPLKKHCRICRGRGWELCPSCYGTGKIVNPPSEPLTTLLKKIDTRLNASLNNSLRDSVSTIRPLLLNATQPELLLLSRLQLKRKDIQYLWKAIPSIPLPRYFDEAETLWRKTGEEWRRKAAFLISYACRYSDFLSRKDFFRCLKKPLYSSPDFNKLLGSQGKSVLQVAAFPENYIGNFLTVEGTLQKITSYNSYFVISLKETGPNGLNLYAWRKEAKREFSSLKNTPWGKMIGRLNDLYPFFGSEKLLELKTNWKIRAVGRLLQNRFRDPSYIVEIWDIIPLYPASQAKICRALEEPVHIALRNVQLQEVLSVIDTLSGLKVQCEGISDQIKLNLIAEDCTTGKMFDKLAKVLKLQIYSQGDTLMLAPKGPAQAIKDMAHLLSFVTKKDSGLLIAGINKEGLNPGSSTSQPKERKVINNPVKALNESLNSMSYQDAILNSQFLLLKTKKVSEKNLLKKYIALSQIGHILTSQVATSNFVNNRKLSQLKTRNPKGKEKTQLLIILQRQSQGLIVKASYGTQFFLPVTQLVSEKVLSVKEWQQQATERIIKRLSSINDYNSKEGASELFSTMVLAKTTGITRKGHNLFKKLVASRAFPWIISTFYPQREKQLLALWKQLGFKSEKQIATGPQQVNGTNNNNPAGTIQKPRKANGKTNINTPGPGETLPTDIEKLKAFGIQHLTLGKRHRRLSLPGNSNFQEELKKATEHFRLARKAFSKYLQQKPENAEIRRTLSETTILLEGCIKDLPFFD